MLVYLQTIVANREIGIDPDFRKGYRRGIGDLQVTSSTVSSVVDNLLYDKHRASIEVNHDVLRDFLSGNQ